MRLKIDPFLLQSITLGVIIIFIAVSITATLNHADQVKLLFAKQLEITDTAVEQNDLMLRIQGAQGNITSDNLNQTLTEIKTAAPQSNFTAQKLATERIANITKDVQANFEGINHTLTNITKILATQDLILQKIDNNTVVANTTVTTSNSSVSR